MNSVNGRVGVVYVGVSRVTDIKKLYIFRNDLT
jgi:hypothetical protein